MDAAALPARLGEFAAAVDDYVAQLLSALALPPELDGMARYHLGWVDRDFRSLDAPRGKGVRPALVLLACEAAGAPWRDALPAAAAVELLHNFSLVHDDIEDRSPLRRHRPTLWAVWGVPRAVNAGDAMFTMAQLAALDQAAPADDSQTPARLLNAASARLCGGQQLDLEQAEGAAPGLEAYYAMIEGKTASLLAVSAELGALAAGAPPAVRAAFARFGREIGLAFQLQDDLLDVWGASEHRGKAALEDLRARKHSLPTVLARSLASGAAAERLRARYDAARPPLGDDALADLVALLEALGVREEGERRVRAHHDAALQGLAEAVPDETRRRLLTALADGLMGRQS
jgi:geranylgeranyl diphosphate synthase type I